MTEVLRFVNGIIKKSCRDFSTATRFGIMRDNLVFLGLLFYYFSIYDVFPDLNS